MWNGSFFSNTTLTAAGLVVQLGHEVGDACPAPSSLRDLMVFDLSGVHRLVVRYCGCEAALSKAVQLFDVHWFPATIDRPAMAFTFNFLDFFQSPGSEQVQSIRLLQYYRPTFESCWVGPADRIAFIYPIRSSLAN